MPGSGTGLDALRARAHARWSPEIVAETEGAAHSGASLRHNLCSFHNYHLVPRALCTSETRMLATTVLGREISMPIMLTPVGSLARLHPDGEIGCMRAASAAGTIMCVSCSSSVPLETIAEAAPESARWFQLALFRDRDIFIDLALRAEAAGYAAVVVMTGTPLRATLGWGGSGHARRSDWDWANLAPYRDRPQPPTDAATAELYGEARDPGYRWQDLERLRRAVGLPIVIKGIMSPEDARIAAEMGFDGITVSNTGGRQLDHAPGTLDVLPEIVDAVQGRVEVFCDGGIRRGADVAKALALGACGIFIGRAYLWGLGADGERGVREVLSLLRRELDEVLALVGRDSIAALDRSVLRSAP